MEWLLLIKIVFLLFMFVCSVLAAIVPFKLGTFKHSQSILGIANSFAGGIFMSIAFIHLLPEVSEKYHDWVHGGGERGVRHDDEGALFPLPFVLLFSGYALILFIDKVLFDSHGYFHEHGEGHSHSEHQGHNHHTAPEKRPLNEIKEQHSSSSDDEMEVDPAFANVALKA